MTSDSTIPAAIETDRRASRDPDRISVLGVGISICFTIAALVIFNAFPQWVGVTKSLADPSSFQSLLTDEFFRYLPLINVWWSLALTLNFVHLGLRRWTLVTRWLDLALHVFGCYVLWQLASAGPLIVDHVGWLTWRQSMIEALPAFPGFLFGAANIFFWVVFAITCVTAAVKLVRLLLITPGLVLVRW